MLQSEKYFVCSIQGAHGVGKSSLVGAIEAEIPGVATFLEIAEKLELMKQPEGEILSTEVFQNNQRLFIRSEIARWNTFLAGQTIVMDRGPEATEFFTLHYPEYRNAMWSAENLLSDELRALRQCRSDLLIYLTAPEEVLIRRARTDVKVRPTFERWLRFFEPRAREWFSKFPTCVFLDTSTLSKAEVVVAASRLIKVAKNQVNKGT